MTKKDFIDLIDFAKYNNLMSYSVVQVIILWKRHERL